MTPQSASDVAVQSGSWQSGSTWQDGTVPATGDRVLIPSGVTVTNHATTADVLWIHVAGTLDCCDHCDTRINAHTIYVPLGGAFHLGSPMMPVQATAALEFTGGPFLPGDWQKLSGGVVCHGQFTACGLDKTHADEVAQEIPVGGTALRLARVPYRWAVGDRLLIAGTDSRVGEKVETYQSEFVTITAVKGPVIEFSPPARFRHFRWRADLPFHCLNLTRNVVIRSRSAAIADRGHLMFMSPMNDVRWTAEIELGRTNKQEPVTDPRIDAVSQAMLPGSDANPRGRYSDHNHKCGPLAPPSIRVGLVVDGSPGWGLVNHASNCEWDRCIAIRCVGFGMGSEEGQERGRITSCIAACNISPQKTQDVSTRREIADAGLFGEGLWLQGGGIEVDGVVAFDNSHVGVHLFNSPMNNYPFYNGAGTLPYLQFPIVHDRSVLDPAIYLQTPEQDRSTARVPFRSIRNVTAYGNQMGLRAWHGHFNTNRVPTAIRNQLHGITVWGRGAVLHLEYSGNSDISGVKIVGDTVWRPHRHVSINFETPLHVRSPNVTITDLEIAGYELKDRTGVRPIFDADPAANHLIDGTYPIVGQGGIVVR